MKTPENITLGIDEYKQSITAMTALLDERQRRFYLATQAKMIGRGGITLISNLSGINRDTISDAIKEFDRLVDNDAGSPNYGKIQNIEGTTNEGKQRIRKSGAGRKSLQSQQPQLVDALLSIVRRDNNYGDPEGRILEWISKSTRNIAEAMQELGYTISHTKVCQILREQGYSLQENRKMKQVGDEHPARDEQFRFINDTADAYLNDNNPVISVDCKKKENLGEFKNDGAIYCEKGKPVVVLDHDFPIPEKGKAVPYGIYDIARNEGFVNVGISADTAAFAVASIRNWWREMGSVAYPNAKRMYITADGGGSNGSRCKLWKAELSALATEIGIPIEVSHFPPGTSKWNKIEHRMFSFISRNWRGRPLETLAIVVSLIAATKTKTGLTIKCKPDGTHYDVGIKITDEYLSGLKIIYNEFHKEWNYTILPM